MKARLITKIQEGPEKALIIVEIAGELGARQEGVKEKVEEGLKNVVAKARIARGSEGEEIELEEEAGTLNKRRRGPDVPVAIIQKR